MPSNGEQSTDFQAYLNHSGSYDKDLEYFPNDDNGSFWDGYDDHDIQSCLDREWQKRHKQFHTIRCPEGLQAGKDSSVQEGFNIGFKNSVPVGYSWGFSRGFTSALACLPDALTEKMLETKEQRAEFQSVYQSVHSISTTDALKYFHSSFMEKRPAKFNENAKVSADVADPMFQVSTLRKITLRSLKHSFSRLPPLK